MTEWSEDLRARVLGFLRILANECKRCPRGRSSRCDECWSRAALSLLRDLEHSRELPPPDYTETAAGGAGGWTYAEDRLARRRALVAQLKAEPSGKLPASRIKLPGITTRTALAKFLARQVAAGLLAYETETPTGGRPARLYFIPRPQSSI